MVQENSSEQISIVDGKYLIHIEFFEMRMSLWVGVFSIENMQTKEVILNFKRHNFHFLTVKEIENTVVIVFQIYPNGQNQYEMSINFDLEQIALFGKIYNFMEYNNSFVI